MHYYLRYKITRVPLYFQGRKTSDEALLLEIQYRTSFIEQWTAGTFRLCEVNLEAISDLWDVIENDFGGEVWRFVESKFLEYAAKHAEHLRQQEKMETALNFLVTPEDMWVEIETDFNDEYEEAQS